MKKTFLARTRAAGFTLVEIMIGLLIGVIGIIVIMQTFAVSEGYRRTTTSGTDATVNGGIAMYIMQNELRTAGFNMQPFHAFGCTSIVVWYNNLGKSLNIRWVPVEINPAGFPAGDPNTDVILITYGNADSNVIGNEVVQGSSPAPFQIKNNWHGYSNGDLVIGVKLDPNPVCVMHELTATPNPNGNCGRSIGTQLLEHGTSAYKDPKVGCQNVQPQHNSATGILDPGGSPVPVLASGTRSKLFSMGPTPTSKIYAIRGGNLTVCATLDKDCTQAANYDVLVNDIVSMRALLGGDYAGGPINPPDGMPGNGVVDRWWRGPLGTSDDVRRTLAMAIELTARSNVKEKIPQGATQCSATASQNLPDKAQTSDWYAPFSALAVGTITDAKIDVSQTAPAGSDWRCYRYKLFQTVVPLRNLSWIPS
jgi:type IV pilus assembly protein PilW